MVKISKNTIENHELKLKEYLVQIENYATSDLKQTTLIKNLKDKIKKIENNELESEKEEPKKKRLLKTYPLKIRNF